MAYSKVLFGIRISTTPFCSIIEGTSKWFTNDKAFTDIKLEDRK